VHEDNITAGFGAEIAATVAKDAFWWLDAPVDRLAPQDIPVPYHEVLLEAVVPTVEAVAERMKQLLKA
jgi:2-oxoisovalerate dehydrogenase E1 component